jgi:hypothetical protein
MGAISRVNVGAGRRGPANVPTVKDPKQADPDTRHKGPASVTGGRLALSFLRAYRLDRLYDEFHFFDLIGLDYTRIKMNGR